MVTIPVKSESKAEDKVLVVQGWLVVKDVLFKHSLPARSGRGFDHRGQTLRKEGPVFAQVNHIEYHPLVFSCVFHGEMEPESEKNVSFLLSIIIISCSVCDGQSWAEKNKVTLIMETF